MTHDKDDMGAFKTPSLYNSASFLYFMHDGALSTMEEVIDHYNQGGDPTNKYQSPMMQPLHLTAEEKSDLIVFLQSLTDSKLNQIHRPALPK